MPRQSYIYDERLKKMVPKAEYYAGLEAADFPMIQPDIQPFKSIIDGEVISSRRDLRNHMRKHDVVPTAEFSAEWHRAAGRRIRNTPPSRSAAAAERRTPARRRRWRG